MKKEISEQEALEQIELKNEIRKEQFRKMLHEKGTITTSEGAEFNHRFGHAKHELVKEGYDIDVTSYSDNGSVFYQYTFLGKKPNFVYKNAKQKMVEFFEKHSQVFLETYEDFQSLLDFVGVHLVSNGGKRGN